ncbi:SDR family oxidoreductase [Moorella stamsii]|uniref:SDR family oxidoreductase n=1 Tax=Neomoorella stamsii TaxID=1266720 RepID=UPI0006D530B6
MRNIIQALRLDGKVALVTGGNRGIGKAIARALGQAGACVAIMDLEHENGMGTVDELAGEGISAYFVQGDVTSPEDVKAAVAEVLHRSGKVDVLVNNAGICRNVAAEEMAWSDWYDVINVNLNGVFLMAQAVGREMIKRRCGSIINISSMSGYIVNHPQPQCSYNASKAAVNHLTKSLAYEWAKYNVRVNAIAPGYIATNITAPNLNNEWGRTWVELTPMKRIGAPEELGGIAVYLASDASSFTTGAVFVVDGGYTLI